MAKAKRKIQNTVLVTLGDLKKQIEKEALSKGLSLSAYVRSLVITHPERKK